MEENKEKPDQITPPLDENDGAALDGSEVDNKEYYEKLSKEFVVTERKLTQGDTPSISLNSEKSWEAAGGIVSEVHPVSKIVWVIIRAVFSKPGIIREAHPGVFFPLDSVLCYAANQRPFLTKKEKEKVTLTTVIPLLGVDVCAALCLIHAICRRVSASMGERHWRPILETGLRRAQAGYYLGNNSSGFGRGRCMIAGFMTVTGLAVSLVRASEERREEILDLLQGGNDLDSLSLDELGCSPLQIAAITLSAAGCGKEGALALTSLSVGAPSSDQESEEYRWIAALKLTVQLLGPEAEKAEEKYWRALGIVDEEGREGVLGELKNVTRKPYNWHWLTWPQKWMVP